MRGTGYIPAFLGSILHGLLLLFIAMHQAWPGEALPRPETGQGNIPVQASGLEQGKTVEWEQPWGGKVVVLPVIGVIMPQPMSPMPELVMRGIDKANADKARLVVLEIDSPGGEVGVCDKLSKKVFDSQVPVVALVLHKAVSGGAMVAGGAREIVMTRAARMGDIQPMRTSITGDSAGMDARTEEKIEVDIRTILKVYAERYRRPVAIFDAMVSRSGAVYQVTFADGTKEYMSRQVLDAQEDNLKKGRAGRRIESTKLIKADGRLLELSGQEAMEYGIASEVVSDGNAFYAGRGIEEEDTVRAVIPEGEFDISKLLPRLDSLGLPVWVIALLGVFLVVAVAGFLTEYHFPGTGVPAACGVIGLACFFATLVMHDRGSPLGIAVFILGIILLVVEIMIIPGFGVTGVLGIAGILGGMFLAFTPAWSSDYMREFMWFEVGYFSFLLFAALVAGCILVFVINKYGHRIPLVGGMFLERSLQGGWNPNPEAMAENASALSGMSCAGHTDQLGVAKTMLRPSGKVLLDNGELLDATSNGDFIDPGTRVRVMSAAPGRIVVAAVG